MAKRVEDLLELAEAEFSQLNVAEKQLFQSVVNGEIADYSVGSEEVDNPANAHQWEEDRIIKSDRLIWLCTEPEVQKLITFRGINLVGVKIEGELNLDFSRIEFPLSFSKCFFPEPIFLRQAKIPRLSFESSYVVSINAALIQIDGSLLLNTGFQSDGEVNLAGAKIGGNLSCQNGKFVGKEKFAISLEGAKITGSVYLRKNPEAGSDNLQGFQAEGLVRLYRASIGGNLECQGGKFINSQGYAIDAEGTDVKGAVLLRNGFEADGGVNLLGATIGGSLECQDGKFVGKENCAILLADVKVLGSVSLGKGFQAEGTVMLFNAKINDTILIQNVIKPEKMFLDLQFAKVRILDDSENSWPHEEKINLNGFVYDAISHDSPLDNKKRLKWLRLQDSDSDVVVVA